MIAILVGGFVLGFAGSLHCVGMCGPLSLALPTWHLTAPMKLISMLVYQFGRISTYALLGLLFGLAGRGLYVAGIQQWFSVTIGAFILLMAVLYFIRGRLIHVPVFVKLYAAVSVLIGKLVKKNAGVTGFFLLGMANGLLPCGMVYIALAAALSFNKLAGSVGFMAMFGAGTLPAMMLVAYSAKAINPAAKKFFKQAIPFFITLTGVILIMRGLNLGIPFLSPQLPAAAGQVLRCH